MSTSTIVLIVLGLVVLVVLIIGFTTQWDVFQGITNPTNVDDAITKCQTTCDTSTGSFGYCRGSQLLRVNEDDLEVETSCYVLANLPEFSQYGFEECTKFEQDCEELSCENLEINDKKGNPDVTSGEYNLSGLVEDENCFITE